VFNLVTKSLYGGRLDGNRENTMSHIYMFHVQRSVLHRARRCPGDPLFLTFKWQKFSKFGMILSDW